MAGGDGGEEIDKAAYGDELQKCITADTKWSEVQVPAVVIASYTNYTFLMYWAVVMQAISCAYFSMYWGVDIMIV